MELPQLILRDLLIGPSSAGAISERFDVSTDDALLALQGNEIAGTVISGPFDCLTVWSLTNEGRAIAETYPKTPQFD